MQNQTDEKIVRYIMQKNTVCKQACSDKKLCPIDYCALAKIDMLAANANAKNAFKYISSEIKNKKCLTLKEAKSIKTYESSLSKAKALLKDAKALALEHHCKHIAVLLDTEPKIPGPCPIVSPPPPPNYDQLYVQIGPNVSYSAYSHLLSDNQVTTDVTDVNGAVVLTINFSINSTVVTATLSQGGQFLTELSDISVNASVINAFNTVATYVASQITFAKTHSNSTASKRKLLNGLHQGDQGEDHPGCDDFVDTACTIGCCAQHDECYKKNDCSAFTWLTTVLPLPKTKCETCNTAVASCILTINLLKCPECGLCYDNPATELVCQSLLKPRLPTGNSCYDHKCGKYYDCPDGCPICPIPYLTPSPADGCCNCESPCQILTPTPAPLPNGGGTDSGGTGSGSDGDPFITYDITQSDCYQVSQLGKTQGCCNFADPAWGVPCDGDLPLPLCPGEIFQYEFDNTGAFGDSMTVQTGGVCYTPGKCVYETWLYKYWCCPCPKGFEPWILEAYKACNSIPGTCVGCSDPNKVIVFDSSNYPSCKSPQP
jgi:hypothetical protein